MRTIIWEQLCVHRYTNFDFDTYDAKVEAVTVFDGARSVSGALPWQHGAVTSGWLNRYRAQGETETADVARMRRLAHSQPDPWLRTLPLHFTASALVVHLESRRVLLRWHQRHRMWLQVGGHGDAGESDPLRIALREAREETGLPDLVPWPDAAIQHAVVCSVPPGKGEPAHEHADVRYFLATRAPAAARPESPDAPLRWLTVNEARDVLGTNNLARTLDRLESLLAEATSKAR
jgi:8-oxo-dGTP pyrophosphatase MutT (NUDIX family)